MLVFCRTRRGAHRLAERLERDGVAATSMHGDLSQSARERALRRFAGGHARVLVATDVAARGIDLDDIGLVINFDPPEDHAAYTHRVGRTARAGRTGRAVTLVMPEHAEQLGKMAPPLGLHEPWSASRLRRAASSARANPLAPAGSAPQNAPARRPRPRTARRGPTGAHRRRLTPGARRGARRPLSRRPRRRPRRSPRPLRSPRLRRRRRVPAAGVAAAPAALDASASPPPNMPPRITPASAPPSTGPRRRRPSPAAEPPPPSPCRRSASRARVRPCCSTSRKRGWLPAAISAAHEAQAGSVALLAARRGDRDLGGRPCRAWGRTRTCPRGAAPASASSTGPPLQHGAGAPGGPQALLERRARGLDGPPGSAGSPPSTSRASP